MAATFTVDTQTTTFFGNNVSTREVGKVFSGGEKIRRGTGNLGTYATAGVAVTPKMLNLKSLAHLNISLVSSDGSTLFFFDKAAKKIKAFSALGTEVTNATDLTSKTFRYQASGH